MQFSKDELKQAGITWSGTLLRQTQVNEPGTVKLPETVGPRHDLLKIMLKKSDNMIADTVFRMIGHALQCAWNMAGRVGRRALDPAPASRCRYWKHHYC
ncbi:D-alanyl-D-alanine carboxypeptidase [Escherichia coli]